MTLVVRARSIPPCDLEISAISFSLLDEIDPKLLENCKPHHREAIELTLHDMYGKRMETELKGFLSEENIADCYFGMAVSYSSSLSNKRQCLRSGGCEKKKRKLSGTDAACKTGNPKLSTLRKVQTA